MYAVRSGEFQRACTLASGRHFARLAAAVRMRGQIYRSVLHQSPTWFITIGRRDVLYENASLSGYCSRIVDALIARAEQ